MAGRTGDVDNAQIALVLPASAGRTAACGAPVELAAIGGLAVAAVAEDAVGLLIGTVAPLTGLRTEMAPLELFWPPAPPSLRMISTTS
jgi:hypothetical protein